MRRRPAIIFVSLLLCAKYSPVEAQSSKVDPHRPACTTSECHKAKSYVQQHYCGAPEGNGPDDSCDIVIPKSHPNLRIVAQFACNWIDGAEKCGQSGQPSPELSNTLTNKLEAIGLPPKVRGQIYFTVWQPIGVDWSLVEAYYDYIDSNESEELCQILGTFDEKLHLDILKKVPFQEVDAEKNNLTTWSALDLADVNGDGHLELVLQGDAYEDHWIEVDAINGGSFKRIFSGLGYYL